MERPRAAGDLGVFLAQRAGGRVAGVLERSSTLQLLLLLQGNRNASWGM